MEAGRGLPNLVAATAAAYESSPYVLGGSSAPQKASPDKLKGLTGATVASAPLGDPWGRIALARLCAALLFADWAGGTEEFCAGVGAPFWRMLTLLATRFDSSANLFVDIPVFSVFSLSF